MRQLRSILVKELRQSLDLFLAIIGVLAVLAWILAKGSSVSEDSVSVLEAIPGLLLLFIPLACLSLSKRLFVSEQQMHTHKFLEALPIKRWWMYLVKYLLEALPIKRWWMYLVKYLLAALVLSISVLLLLGIVIARAYQSELITGDFFLILLGRSAAYTFLVWSFCFLVGFSGRFRNTIFTASFLLVVGVGAVTSIPLNEVGPLALVNQSDMPYERNHMPWKAFYQCLLWGAAASLGGFAFALWRGGQLAQRMAGHMSLKEKSWAGVLMLLFLLVVSLVDFKRAKEPFEFSAQNVVSSQEIPLDILYFDEASRIHAEALHHWLETKLLSLRKEVLLSPLPPIRVALGQSLDGETFESASMGRNDGLLWRCNYAHPKFNQVSFGGEIFHSVITQTSRGMATFDPDHWFLDGFCTWWAEANQEERLVMAHWLMREQKLDRAFIEKWALLTDRYGFQGAFHLGYSGLSFLEETWGREVVTALARDVYSVRHKRDVRDVFHRLSNPLSALLEKRTQVSYDAFLQSWGEWLQGKGGKKTSPFPNIPQMEASISLQGGDLHYELSFGKEAPLGAKWSLSHAALAPYDHLLEYHDLRREEHFWPAGERRQSQVLKDTYSPGQRVLAVIELELPGYRYPFQVRSQRVEIP